MAGGNKGNAMQAKLRGDVLSFPVKIATAIFRGTMVAIDSAGYLVQAADTAAMKFVGISEESCTVAEAVADGTVSIRVRRRGIFRMTKNTTSAVTDVGQIAFAHTAQTASVDSLVGLAGATTYDNAVGLIVRREPDTPGGTTFTYNWLMVDITPAAWSVLSLTAHAALADQSAHTDNAVGPVLSTDATATAAVTSAKFIGKLMTLSYNGAVAVTLPASGPIAGTLCRFVKTGTVGLLTIGATALIGPQCASNSFIGCPNPGDSVLIQCVGADSYMVVHVQQAKVVTDYSSDNPTIAAAAFVGGQVTLSKAGATTTASTLPATGVPVGARCTVIKTGSAGDCKLASTTFVGGGTTTNKFTLQDAVEDVVTVENVAAASYRVISYAVA